jgi:hypothetical protein
MRPEAVSDLALSRRSLASLGMTTRGASILSRSSVLLAARDACLQNKKLPFPAFR